MAINTCLSVITLILNDLNVPTKRHGSWTDKKTRPIYMLSPIDPPQIERYTQTKSKGLEKDSSCKWKRQKAGVPVPISDKIDFKTKAI